MKIKRVKLKVHVELPGTSEPFDCFDILRKDQNVTLTEDEIGVLITANGRTSRAPWGSVKGVEYLPPDAPAKKA